MLEELHVKNFALIKEAGIVFGKGLNIITGETGAGKSLLLGSLDLALGGKMSQGILRPDAEDTLVELIFVTKDPQVRALLDEYGISYEEDQIVITRKVTQNRSMCRVNGEVVSLALVKKLASYLFDIHGQHENQSLLLPAKQLEIIDGFGGEKIREQKEKVRELYLAYAALKKKMSDYDMDESSRQRELSLLQYEIRQIEAAALRDGEEEELEQQYRLMSNARDILEVLGNVHDLTGYDNGAGEKIGAAVREMKRVAECDKTLTALYETLNDAESLIEEVNRQAASYLDDFEFSDAELSHVENRLDEIRSLMAKYGRTVDEVFAYAQKQQERLVFLEEYDREKELLEKQLQEITQKLDIECGRLSDLRKEAAAEFSQKLCEELHELNFAQVRFETAFTETASFREDGKDHAEFMISANPGEPIGPLSKVASGGELSRIMLAIRVLLSDADHTKTLVFDEIDAGISGRTAQKVSEKMARIASSHQLICVTHLAQIAAMADEHFQIAKESGSSATRTYVKELSKQEAVEELERILGGAKITEAVRSNAAEMKQLAEDYKKTI